MRLRGQPPVVDHPRRDTAPWLLALLALALRAAVLIWRRAHDPLFGVPINDAAVYDHWANALAAGRPFGAPESPFYLPPLYPYFLSLVYRFGGAGWWPTAVLQAAGGAVTVVGVHRLGRTLFGHRAGLAAGLLALLLAPPLWCEGWLLPSGLELLLLVLILNTALWCHRGVRRWALGFGLLGLLLGLAAVNRPQQLLLLMAIPAWLGWTRRRDRLAAAGPLALLALGAAAAIMPVTIRNLRVSGEPILISANGGMNFYLGNFAGADGRFAMPPDFPPLIDQHPEASRRLAAAATGRALSWSGTSDYWLGQGWRSLSADPGRAARLYLRKLHLLLAWREWDNNFLVGWVHRHTGPGRWLVPSVGLLWILALPAMVASLRTRDPRTLALWIPLGVTVLTCLLFWVSTRNRLPVMVPLTVFAGASLTRPRQWLRAPTLAAVALAATAVFWPTADRERGGFYADLGRAHAERGRIPEARAAFQQALAVEPGLPMALNGLALTYMDAGDPETAIAMLRDLVRRHPDFELARKNLEAILRRRE